MIAKQKGIGIKMIWLGLSLSILGLANSCSQSEGSKKNLGFAVDSLTHQLQAERRLNQKYQYYINQVLPKLDKSINSEELVSITIATPGDFNQQIVYPNPVNVSSTESNARVASPQGLNHVATLEYQPGASGLTEGMRQALTFMADSLRNSEQYLVLIEGHTDNSEAKGDPRLEDGWQLSTNRASEVARFLFGKGVYPHMMVAAGRSNFKPVASFQSEKSNSKNRRVDIFLMPAALK
ncbi:MAG: OmpA family protein [Bacteroidia bacterium]|nr:OmpA family protein [Bacteroidia bacterium]